MRTTNGAANVGNRWEGHTGGWVQALPRGSDQTRAGYLCIVRYFTLYRDLDVAGVPGGARYVPQWRDPQNQTFPNGDHAVGIFFFFRDLGDKVIILSLPIYEQVSWTQMKFVSYNSQKEKKKWFKCQEIKFLPWLLMAGSDDWEVVDMKILQHPFYRQ